MQVAQTRDVQVKITDAGDTQCLPQMKHETKYALSTNTLVLTYSPTTPRFWNSYFMTTK